MSESRKTSVAAVQEWSMEAELDHSQGCQLVDLENHQKGEVVIKCFSRRATYFHMGVREAI